MKYHFSDFSNIISKTDIKTIAESDIQEVVREVQEYYADFLSVAPHLFSFNIPSCGQCNKNKLKLFLKFDLFLTIFFYVGLSWDPLQLTRCTQGIISVLLSLKKYPLIRFQASSKMSKQLAEKIKVN